MSDVLRCPVCSCAHSLCTLSMRPRVQRASGIPCALFSESAGDYLQSSGAMRRENANTHSVSSSRTRGPSIPETLVIESRSLGVLDARLRGHDTGGDDLTRGLEPLFGQEPHCGIGVHRLAEGKALCEFAAQLIKLDRVRVGFSAL